MKTHKNFCAKWARDIGFTMAECNNKKAVLFSIDWRNVNCAACLKKYKRNKI